ncbi:hypothetical protein QVD17_02663 [Tagetes erecta]|uniref:Uncharacterized protein n=1 Tax=Tagetes erecta TaxID=13708 RepID=A0AAD8P920_TARER|nr:hypothetical protein QVD17_02663 [Tagetes erecta]
MLLKMALCISACIEGLEILKGFTPLRIGSVYRLKLPENWCNDFSGFLMCTVLSKYIFFGLRTSIGIKQMNGVEFEEDMVWEESDGDSDVYMTYVWYVPFGSLRHTTWWDQTYKALEFNILDTYKKPIAFGVRLVDKESTSGVSETSTNSSSPYTPKFKIIHDSAFELTAKLVPYNLWLLKNANECMRFEDDVVWEESGGDSDKYIYDMDMENETIEAIRFKESSPHYSLPLGKLVSNMKKLRWLVASSDGQEVPTYLSNELRYIHLYYYPASFFRGAFLPKKLVVLKLYKSMQKELWKDNQHLPNLKVLELVKMKMLLKTPNFDELPCLQKLILRDCCTLKEIHPSLGHHTSLEYLYVSDCIRLKKLPAISQMKNIRTLLIMWCSLEDAEIPYGIGDLSYLQELNLCGNDFSRLDFSLSQLTQLKCLNLSYCDNLLELPELPSSLVVLTTYLCSSLTVIEDFNKKCKHLCQVSFIDGWGDKLLRSMLQGKTIENGSMHLYLEGCEIPKGFTPPLLRGDVSPIQFGTRITVKQLRGDVYFEDDVVWEESDGDSDYDMTWVCKLNLWKHKQENIPLEHNVGAVHRPWIQKNPSIMMVLTMQVREYMKINFSIPIFSFPNFRERKCPNKREKIKSQPMNEPIR